MVGTIVGIIRTVGGTCTVGAIAIRVPVAIEVGGLVEASVGKVDAVETGVPVSVGGISAIPLLGLP